MPLDSGKNETSEYIIIENISVWYEKSFKTF